jgi:hypothetical protein
MSGSMQNNKLVQFMCWTSLALLSTVVAAGPSRAQNPNQIEARPLINVEDKDDIHKTDGKVWVLNFSFYAPRMITVDLPGRGRRICWYIRYEVINRTGQPRIFNPNFELVTTDLPGKVFMDEVLPKAQDAIREIEDPLGHMDIKNSVTISEKPIPVTRPDGPPKPVTGVAIWADVPPDSNRFSIFVRGLSNGWSLATVPPDNKKVLRVKTLQLNFKRVGDRFNQQTGDIRFVPPVEWVYRAIDATVPDTAPAAAGKK